MPLIFTASPVFQDELVPDGVKLVGFAALVAGLGINAPVRAFACVAEGHVRGSIRQDGKWTIYDKRYWPGETLGDHLTFALKHESLDLLVLKRIFNAVEKEEMAAFVNSAPNGAPNRRAWYLYEILTKTTLDLPDSGNVSAINLLDPKIYFTAPPKLSKRHRVRDNLLGNERFCPIIRRTAALETFLLLGLAEKAKETIGRTGGHLVARAASFLLLADSRASFEIEGERPPRNRLERWGKAVLQAGRNPLSLGEIIRLHSVLVEDVRFVQVGLRRDGVFLGERDHNGDPMPEFIGARPDDLQDLIDGLIEANARMRDSGLDAVLQAAAMAFGFVYIHPFEDGNGRLHRCLIHHVLAERKFTPPGMVFPVSSVMLDRIDIYRNTLRTHSGPLMEYIEWRPTPARNVDVTNDTADLYRFFDCTEAAEFLSACVQHTVEQDLPREIDYIQRHDDALRQVMNTVEMPDRLAEDFIMFVRQNNGTLSNKRRQKEFEALKDDEVATLEEIVRDIFEGFVG